MSVPTVLVLTNSADVTSDFLCAKFKEAGIIYVRYNTDIDCSRAIFLYKDTKPCLKWGSNHLYAEHVSSIVLRRPKPIELNTDMDRYTKEHTIGEWAEALEGFLAHIDQEAWINHPANNSMASHKVEQLTRAKKCGLMVPLTIVTNDPISAEEFIRSQVSGVIVKPLASGFIEREDNDTIIYTRLFEEQHFEILEQIRECPVMFQSRILKEIDVRVTVLDETVVAVALQAGDTIETQRLDIRRDNMNGVNYTVIDIPASVESSIKALLKSYNLRFGALDFGITKTGEWFFFEINPNGQWAWLDICGDADISDVFVSKLRNR